jgi:CRISPR/Cas system-associated exonuclease Cas4 (RecB family)
MLTKTDYLAYSQCPKQFWLSQHQPTEKTPPDEDTQRRFRVGHQIDEEARALFPTGKQIPYRPHPTDMAEFTAQAIQAGESVLFQATFTVADLLIKADVLQKVAGGWHLIEVKSSSSKKAEHVVDIAFQVYVLQQAGMQITQASVMHLNKSCCYPDLDDLFEIVDVMGEMPAYLPQIALDIESMRTLSRQTTSPNVHIGRHCQKPHTCSFYDHCWANIDGLTIYDIPRLGQKKEQQLETDGVLYLSDMPATFPLTNTQRNFVTFYDEEQINIDGNEVQVQLNELDYPLYFLDFETINHAIPCYDGCTPYQQVPFQYSCHVLEADGTLTHFEYLHTQNDDPRSALVASLLENIGDTGHITAYYIPFERKVLRELAQAFPEYATALISMVERLWDQLDIFKKYYRHYGFGKSNSLKSVLPVVVPGLSYDVLAVQNGTQAQTVWEQMLVETIAHEKEKLVAHLLEYCELDTQAMVKIHEVLSDL